MGLDFIIEENRFPSAAKAIRKEVFVIEQGFPESDEWDDVDSSATHIVLIRNNTPIGTCRVFRSKETGGYVLGRLAVLKAYRGNGYGALLLKKGEAVAKAKGAKILRLAAQVRALGFYEKAGYQTEGTPFLEETVPHIWMSKPL